jgi:SAM-dependent methyltransferase
MNNIRVPEMWKILREHYNFSEVSALDLGCGYGDMLVNLYVAGAKYIHGYEKDLDVFRIAHEKTKGFPSIKLHFMDLEENGWLWPRADVAFCFSVLWYLERPAVFLSDFRGAAVTNFIEVQYAGDGPGPKEIKHDEHMRGYLRVFWDNVEPIGKTYIEGRDKWRTIWMCQ